MYRYVADGAALRAALAGLHDETEIPALIVLATDLSVLPLECTSPSPVEAAISQDRVLLLTIKHSISVSQCLRRHRSLQSVTVAMSYMQWHYVWHTSVRPRSSVIG
jgi:hypothetical protein